MCVCGAAAAAAAAVVVLAVVTRMSWLWMAHQISNSASKLHIVLSAAHTLMDSERAWGRISWIPSTHLQYDETYNEESYCVCKTHNERRERKKVNSFSSRWTWHSFDRIAFVYTERFWLIYILAARAAVFAASAHKWMAHMDYYFIVLLKFIVHPTKWMPRMPDPSANREEETPRAFRCVFVGIDFNFQRWCVCVCLNVLPRMTATSHTGPIIIIITDCLPASHTQNANTRWTKEIMPFDLISFDGTVSTRHTVPVCTESDFLFSVGGRNQNCDAVRVHHFWIINDHI